MRFLICPGGGYGSLHPLVPLARALADRGHAVAFATPPMHLGTVSELGFEGFPAGPAGAISGIAADETAAELAELGEAARARQVIGAFAALAEAMAPELSAVVRRWRPDVLAGTRPRSRRGCRLVAAGRASGYCRTGHVEPPYLWPVQAFADWAESHSAGVRCPFGACLPRPAHLSCRGRVRRSSSWPARLRRPS